MYRNNNLKNLLSLAMLLINICAFAQNTTSDSNRKPEGSKPVLQANTPNEPPVDLVKTVVADPVNIDPANPPKRIDHDAKIPDFKEEHTMPAMSPRNPRKTSINQ